MLDFEEIARITFLVKELGQVLFLDGMIIDENNFAQYISSIYDT